MVEGYHKNTTRANFTPGSTLPRVSTHLDAVRAYQFEVKFYGLPVEVRGSQQELTAAAKQVSPIGGSVDDIPIDRVNDKVYIPGKFTPDPVTITFDNQLLNQNSPALWKWFKSIYDPLTGDMTKFSAPGGAGNSSFKANKMTIVELDNTQEPHSYIELYGVYPTTVRFSEKNYSTNDVATIEVTFRFDFLDYNKYSN
tara:strand:+ start:2449 stop:3039 length:591 start_codon:yes stop_codon:yes gene_type:complete